MRAISTTVIHPGSSPLAVRSAAVPTRRGSRLFGGLRLRRRTEPTLFHRCLAVHMAAAGTLSALR